MESIEQWNARVEAERASLFRLRHGKIVKPEPKPGSRHPFKRAAKLYTEIMELRAAHTGPLINLQIALGELPPYVSRGHGWKGRIKNRTILGSWNQDRSKTYPDAGKSEAARRVFQRLPLRERMLVREIEVGI